MSFMQSIWPHMRQVKYQTDFYEYAHYALLQMNYSQNNLASSYSSNSVSLAVIILLIL